MPGPQLHTVAFILARQPSGSDKFEQLSAFAPDHGVLSLLARSKQTKSAPSPLDLFDEAELWLESSSQGRTWFIKEYRLIHRHEGIGRSYEALKVAAAIARLLTRNPVPDESRGPAGELLRISLGSLADNGRTDLIWLKTLYCLLRDEGYPVKQQWWAQLPVDDRQAAAQILNQPLAAQSADPTVVARIIRLLETWVGTETEIRL